MGIVEPLLPKGLLVQHGESIGYESVIKVSVAKVVCVKSEIYPQWYLSLGCITIWKEIRDPNFYVSVSYGGYTGHLGHVERILQSRVSANARRSQMGLSR